MQREIGIDFAEKKPGPGIAVDQIRVFSDPAEPCLFSDCFFQYGRAVDEHPVTEIASNVGDLASETGKSFPHKFVVVTAQRVSRHVGFGRMIKKLGRRVLVFGQIIHANGDDRDCAFNEFGRSTAFDAMPFHVGHASVKAFGKPFVQAVFSRR